MHTIFLDSNIYDLLEKRQDLHARLQALVAAGDVRVIVTPVMCQELSASPFRGVPQWFPIQLMPESVCVADHAFSDMAFTGPGDVFRDHRGMSEQHPDAIAADSAATFADVVVSEDRRFRRRLKLLAPGRRVFDFSGFETWLGICAS
jgi:hypothetical protein